MFVALTVPSLSVFPSSVLRTFRLLTPSSRSIGWWEKDRLLGGLPAGLCLVFVTVGMIKKEKEILLPVGLADLHYAFPVK